MSENSKAQSAASYQLDPQLFQKFILQYIQEGAADPIKNLEVRHFFEINPHLSQLVIDGTGTLVHHAVDCHNHDIMNLLLRQGADINAVSGRGMTPLTLAIRHKSLPTVELLLSSGASLGPLPGVDPLESCLGVSMKPEFYSPSIFMAVLQKLHEQVGHDPDKVADRINDAGGQLPHAAYAEAAELVVKRMIERYNYDVNSIVTPGRITALLVAAQTKNVELGTWLVTNGADVNLGSDIGGRTALYWATYYGSGNLASVLLDKGDENFRTPE